ncbi:chemotaxis response regulator protein-glutamate methylesterase [Methylocaldum marinum]|uniref:Protein-glutamate methylesterase/protein-glutamine glutaminase n=1 Tax=Methylocaldum marinum TaxID=1432792 RepID=A0A250KTQ0_9GAMM|nr:chemotaxis response regulator protein-glutamate methylesterase [Methylocaldum marinum]BBA34331.1 chemotaxis response regulator protein-glutamate methylesterase [Methylocaldum marinum]
MTIRVLVVDDSGFIRRRLTEIFNADGDMEVIGCAADGAEAVRKAASLNPDVITMDVDMPVMDGITAVREIMKDRPTPILMFSASTRAGAKATLDALDAGAMDFVPKQLQEISGDQDLAKRILRRRVRDLAEHAGRLQRVRRPAATVVAAPVARPSGAKIQIRDFRLIVIAASTGGPVAIQKVLTEIPETAAVPILLVQHMPGNFTGSFAERLDQLCRIRVREARNGDELRPGAALLAPGGLQLELSEHGARKTVVVRESGAGEHFRPSADVTFGSVARNMPGKVLAIVLTGMGSDGKLGAQNLKAKGAVVWAQNEQSCVVYGMPKAIVDAGLADCIYDLDEMAGELKNL